MNIEESHKLADERVDLIRKTVNMEKTDRVPFIDSCFTWKVLDQGYKLGEALYDYGKLEECVRGHMERYQPDCTRDTGTRNGFKVIEGWADTRYILNDETGAISALDDVFMMDNEYGELLENRQKYVWTKMLPRRYPQLAHSTKEQIRGLVKGFQEYFGYSARMNTVLKDEYGIPPLSQYGLRGSGHEYFVNYLRGLAGTGVDQRRHKAEMLEAIKMYDAKDIDPVVAIMKNAPGPNKDFAFDVAGGCLSHTILNPKQFEEFYLPGFKKGLDACRDTNKTIYIFVQGTMDRFIDLLQEYPKGVIVMHVEQEDVRDMRKKLPNIALAGGFPTTTLGSGTVEQVKDEAKQLIDDMACDGGFFMSTNKILSFRNDATRENYMALTQFVREYRG